MSARAGGSIVVLCPRWTTNKKINSLCGSLFYQWYVSILCSKVLTEVSDVPMTSKQTIYDSVHRFRETLGVKERPRSSHPLVLAPDILESVADILERTPKLLHRRLS